ncbi:2,6-dihydroxypyridine 3-monooxygenase, partial [Lachnellula arida]
LIVYIQVGGSLSGLLHAIVFKHLGHNVHVLERSPQYLLRSQAAGLRAGPDVSKFIDKYVKLDESNSMWMASQLLETVDVDGGVISSFPPTDVMLLTTWSLLYDLLKTNLLKVEATLPVTYETGKIVRDVKYHGNEITVAYSDATTKISNVLRADLVIAADGGHSTVRTTVLPDLRPKYAGFVTWRGVVPETSVPEATRQALRKKTLMFRTATGYTVSYYVPSETGSVEPGDCQFIWIWYEKLEENTKEFQETFTDVDSQKHFTTIPRGKVSPKVWERKRELGTALSKPFSELIQKTTSPFVSAIRDCSSANAVFHDGKLVLVGDAFSLFRPHAAMSLNQASKQALGLAEVFQGKTTLQEWEEKSIHYAKATNALSNGYGEYCFTGKVPTSLSNVNSKIKPGEQAK